MTDATNAPAQSEAEALAPELLRGFRLSKFFEADRGPLSKKVLVRAVQHASLHVRPGETVGLVGESGSGKTTLGRLLVRLLDPNFGRVYFEGADITYHHERDLRPLRRKMQILFQDARAALDDRHCVADIIAEPLRIHARCAGAEERRRVVELADMVGLARGLLTRRPPELSTGQCQRVNIARALALAPSFIVCDEPMSALDVSEQQRIAELLATLQDARGHAYLLISHHLPLVLHLSRRVYVMYAGRIVESGPAEALRERARHPYTRALLYSVPELDPLRRRLRVVLEGEPPSPFRPIAGCPFHPRCPRARPGHCEREAPDLVPLPSTSDQGSAQGYLEHEGARSPHLGYTRDDLRHEDLRHEVACWYPLE